ncbi:MAG: hypothetical protein Q8J97_13820, partial [Flavobacteriaceae bacterium]|nr:hypothetical protein [Flavobacteriaceae bacterium]
MHAGWHVVPQSDAPGDDGVTAGGDVIMFVSNISSEATIAAARRADEALLVQGTQYISSSSLRDAYNLDVGIVVVSDKAAATKRWRDTVEVILIIFALTTIANFVLCYFTGTLLFATPLERLSAAMVRQSVFAWSEGGAPHSRITELYHAELAFNFLCHETQGLKQFVPFAVSSEEATEVSSFRQHTADGSHTHSSLRPPSSQLLTISSHSSSMNVSTTTGNPLGSRQQARGRTTILQRSVRLNTSRALNFGHVSVLALSMSGFHQRLSDMVASLDVYASSVAAVVECVVHATTRFRGNLDTFYGDIFLISFNSLHKQSQHKKAAV